MIVSRFVAIAQARLHGRRAQPSATKTMSPQDDNDIF